ncbi:MAG: 4-hydroxy-3-methylbut-2-enyl diphosphate reductase [Proteobacteria bacterium]|nr:4-hydroxy-3-methylbut-2-enyl diphosphate reductase [Pseudomonadota bacterium]MCH8057618.1 4-hydroxy-3-methylbut-2-enyl diphosphate reductase [Pseudomonadota bacterium]MCH8227128.1 4-hydroxy-3-methylbut-2-enyl diphosphate reductase [Pseudomonadota bacterium]
MKVFLANPRGFCAGVDRAIDIVERALELFGAPIYVRHEVVHNRFVVDKLARAGAVFVDELDQVPDNSIVIFSAHGVSQSVRKAGEERGLKVFDATCPLVTKVHMEVARHCRAGRDAVLIGHAGHPEVEGTLGQWLESPPNNNWIKLVESPEDVQSLQVEHPEDIAYVTQTTLSVDDTHIIIQALKERFPAIQGPKHDDICYATQNRQDAVKELAQKVDVMMVVGSINSSNSNRLRELAEKQGITAYLIDGADDIEEAWIQGINAVGLTAGASAPESLVQEVREKLEKLGGCAAEEVSGRLETMEFALPRELRIQSD